MVTAALFDSLRQPPVVLLFVSLGLIGVWDALTYALVGGLSSSSLLILTGCCGGGSSYA